MRTIMITARFEVHFEKEITDEQFAELEAGDVSLEEVVDESEAYHLAGSEGDCDMDWDYDAPKANKKRAKK